MIGCFIKKIEVLKLYRDIVNLITIFYNKIYSNMSDNSFNYSPYNMAYDLSMEYNDAEVMVCSDEALMDCCSDEAVMDCSDEAVMDCSDNDSMYYNSNARDLSPMTIDELTITQDVSSVTPILSPMTIDELLVNDSGVNSNDGELHNPPLCDTNNNKQLPDQFSVSPISSYTEYGVYNLNMKDKLWMTTHFCGNG